MSNVCTLGEFRRATEHYSNDLVLMVPDLHECRIASPVERLVTGSVRPQVADGIDNVHVRDGHPTPCLLLLPAEEPADVETWTLGEVCDEPANR